MSGTVTLPSDGSDSSRHSSRQNSFHEHRHSHREHEHGHEHEHRKSHRDESDRRHSHRGSFEGHHEHRHRTESFPTVVPAQVYPAPIITPAPAPVTTTVIVPPSAPVVVAATTPTYTKEYRSDVVQTRVFLQPIAPPQPLGLWGYSIGTFIVGAYLAGWFSQNNGNALSIIAPFAFFTGGLLQAIAAHQAFRARCAFSTVSFGIWSSLWFAFAFMWMMVLLGALAPVLGYFPEHAIWWVPLIVLSAMLTGAALLENLGVMLVYFFVTIASVLMAASYFWHPDDNCNISNPNDSCIYRNYRLREAAGYFFVFSAAAAMYTGLWFLLSFMSGRDLVPNYRFTWSEKRPRIHGGENEPGVKKCM